MSISRNHPLTALLMALLVFPLAGCTSRIHIKAIDASTKEPLPGVVAEWRQSRYQMFQTIVHGTPTKLPPSGPDGVIRVNDLKLTWTSEFTLSCTGYSNVHGNYDVGGGMSLSDQIRYYPPDIGSPPGTHGNGGEFMLTNEIRVAVKKDGYFIVPMQKVDPTR